MRQLAAVIILGLVLCFCCGAGAESMEQTLEEIIGGLDLTLLNASMQQQTLLQGDLKTLLIELSTGKTLLSPEGALTWLLTQAAGIFASSLWRVTRLMAPALMVTASQGLIKGKTGSRTLRYTGLMSMAVFLIADLQDYVKICTASVTEMAELMQAIFPLLITLLAAVGGTASSAFYQPAIMAAAGSMTTLVQNLTLPLAVCVAVLTMADSLSADLRLSRMRQLIHQAANWTLGFGFTVFIGVMTVQGVGAAAVDGVSIRTAKYALDNFIPIVGGMFADTVDTLVGCSLLLQNAVGVLGLILLLIRLLAPLLRTVAVMLLYRAASAVLQPMADTALNRSIGDYADVFSLLFIIQLSVGAMFLLLCAQLILVGNLTVMLR